MRGLPTDEQRRDASAPASGAPQSVELRHRPPCRRGRDPRYIVAIGLAFGGCAAPPMPGHYGVATEHPAAEHPTALYARSPADAPVDSWRYAQWGMTPNKVVSASAGRVTLLKEGKIEHGSAEDNRRFGEMQQLSRKNDISLSLLDQFKGATSAINVAGLQLDISFMFNGRNDRLVSVLLRKSSCTSDELDKLTLLLKLKFGSPFEHYRMEGIGFSIWKWTSASDLIELTTTKDADKSSSTCIISYEPISTAGL